jgi:multiple sugar transport system ATP-binding protein
MGLFHKKDKPAAEVDVTKGQPTVTKQEILERRKELAKEHIGGGEVKPKDLAYVSLRHIDKVYENGVQAVYDFTLDVKRYEFIVFVGPSGCGKSTTLRMIAGLEDITNGDLYIDGEYANDKSPKDRDIAMVFQSYALYPHMTVYNNMAFGLKIRHLPKAEIDKRVHEAAKILQIEEYLDRKPKALSGGQRQRVALGRAIVRNAKVFLMDEPLSNLDAKLRVQMRSEIIKLTEALGATTIYVTHDQTEAMTMASRIVVMKAGHIQQIGTPIEIYNHPANVFVAGFIGSPSMNLLKATYDNGVIVLGNGDKIACDQAAIDAHKAFYEGEVKEVEGKLLSLRKNAADPKIKAEIDRLELQLTADKNALVKAHSIVFGIRPEDIHELVENDELFGGTAHPIKVAVAELLGHEYYIHTDFANIDLIAKIPLTHEIKIGDGMKIVFDQPKAHIFDPITEKRVY